MHGMFGSRPSFLAFSVSALTLVLTPSLASASSPSGHPGKVRRTARALDSHPCSKPAVEVVAGSESSTFPLERCDGEPIPASIDKLSILARSAGAAKPKEPLTGKPHGAEVAPGIRRLDARLAERLEVVAAHFRKEGEPTRIVLVAPKSRTAGSYHASGRALDFRIEGADNDAVVAFCKTVQDTGCGYYPNGGFVHMDVRDAGAGHVAWIDVSKPGEAPKYVSAWPLPGDAARSDARKIETVTAEAPKEIAKAEAPQTPAPVDAKASPSKAEAIKTEPSKEADSADEAKLPSLPAAAAVVPMADPPSAPGASEPGPARKHHRRHKKSRTSHTI
jgi:uncharacterized protein YcbK (DUF882 family)